MNITWNQIKQLSSALYSELTKILKSNFYKLISEDLALQLINDSDVIVYLIKNYDKFEEAKDKIIEEFEKVLKNEINSQISSNNIDIIKNYLKPHEKKFKNIKSKYIGVNILSQFFNELEITPDLDILISIYNNIDFVRENIENIAKNNIKSIMDGTFTFSCNNEILISFIDIYCLKNDIHINIENETLNAQTHSDVEDYDEENEDLSELNKDYSNFEDLDTYQIDLTKQILIDSHKYPLLPQEEIRELIIKAQNGSKYAAEKIVLHNQRLVINILQKYLGSKHEFLDLYQEGCIGLSKAIERFDLSKGFRFSTYATWWVRQAITRYIADCGRTIRIPVHLNEKLSKLNKITNHYINDLNKEPSIEELAKEMRCSEKTILELIQHSKDAVSFNTKVDDESESELVDFISSDVNIENDYDKEHFQENVLEYFNSLNIDEREKYVALHRFDIPGFEHQTLEALGKKFNVTRERIRQIEKKAKRKIFISKNPKKFCALFPNPEAVYKQIMEYRKNYYKEREEEIFSNSDHSYTPLTTKTGTDISKMQELILELTPSDYEFIKKHYDQNFNPISDTWNEPEAIITANSIIDRIKNIIKNSNTGAKIGLYDNLCNLFHLEVPELAKLISKLCVIDQIHIKKLYDCNFKRNKTIKLLNTDYNRLSHIKKEIELMIKIPDYSPKASKNLSKIIGVTPEELDDLADYLSMDIQRFLKKHYDENWDERSVKNTEEKAYLKSVIELLKRIKKQSEKALLRKNATRDKTEQLSNLELIIVMGLVSKDKYDITAIANFLNLEEEYVIATIKERLISIQSNNNGLLQDQLLLTRKKRNKDTEV